jgi:hypothetical protein
MNYIPMCGAASTLSCLASASTRGRLRRLWLPSRALVAQLEQLMERRPVRPPAWLRLSPASVPSGRWQGSGNQRSPRCILGTWATGDARCAALSAGARLATFTSLEEWQQVLAAALEGLIVSQGELWVGYTDAASEGTWRALDGSAIPAFMYAAFTTSQPDNYGVGQHCAAIWTNSNGAVGLDDDSCNAAHRTLCKLRSGA